jgi:type I restriction enzyme R subunit
LAIKIAETVLEIRPDEWRGIPAREMVIKAGLYGILQDADEVERIFQIIRAQGEF